MLVNAGSEVLSAYKDMFFAHLTRVLTRCEKLDALTFYKLALVAHGETLGSDGNKITIFCHIHNRHVYAKLNFILSATEASWLKMVREPIQICESWIAGCFRDGDHQLTSSRIVTMLYQVDDIIFKNRDSIGVRL